MKAAAAAIAALMLAGCSKEPAAPQGTPNAAAIRQHLEAATATMASGSFGDLAAAERELAEALALDGKDPAVLAQHTFVTSLQSLLYGVPAKDAATTIDDAARAIKGASLDDRWARWLQARAQLLAGDRAAARAGLQALVAGADPLVPALIDLADLLVDDGDLDGADSLYVRALAASKGHPLALLGQCLAWLERGVEVDRVLTVLNVELYEKKNLGPRVRAYRQLADALARYQIEDYEDVARLLAASNDGELLEPRYLGRLALARLLAGDLAAAAATRARVSVAEPSTPARDPALTLFDAAWQVESGLPARALETLADRAGGRAHLIRAQALLDLGASDPSRLTAAVAEAEAAVQAAPDSAEAAVLVAWAHVVSAPAARRDALIEGELTNIALKLVSRRGRHAEGAALYTIGSPDARRRLEQAVSQLDASSPNPVAHRSHTLLARLDLAAGKPDQAGQQIEAALAAHAGYLPAMVIKSKLQLGAGDAAGALRTLAPVLAHDEAVTPEVADLRRAAEAAAKP